MDRDISEDDNENMDEDGKEYEADNKDKNKDINDIILEDRSRYEHDNKQGIEKPGKQNSSIV